MNKRVMFIITVTILLIAFPLTAFAHSGRTDSRGGHKDNKNKSGLGSYHYHCGGYPAHLHKDGICPYAPKDYITLNDYPKTLKTGESYDLDFTMHSYYNDFSYTITSSDSSILKVNNDDSVTGVGVGTAILTIKTSHAEKAIEVKVKEVFAEELKISTSSKELQIDNTMKIYSIITPSNTTNKKVVYESSDSLIASVSSDGIIKGISSGDVTITVTTSNGISDEITLIVYEVFPEDIVCDESIRLIVGDKYNFMIDILPENANNKDFDISFTNEDILQYSNNTITAIKEGNTSVYIKTWNGIVKNIPIQIDIIPVDQVNIIDSTKYIYSNIIDVSDNILLSTETIPTDATYQDVIWSSSDTNVVSVENNEFNVKGVGEVILTCNTHNNITDSVEIIVVDKDLILSTMLGSISLGGGGITLFVLHKKKKLQISKIDKSSFRS